MNPDHLISTPENVDLHLELAGIGNRVLACFIDIMLCLLALLLVSMSMVGLIGITQLLPLPETSRDWLSNLWLGLLVLISLGIYFGYFIFFEGTWAGQSPGKKLVQIRTVEQSGQPVSWTGAVVRNLIRVIDLGLFLVGLLLIVLDSKERRLGDFAAGTLVIKERQPRLLPITYSSWSKQSGLSQAADLSVSAIKPSEYDLLVNFLQRREQLTSSARHLLASELADYFRQRLSQTSQGESAEWFLERVYASYAGFGKS